MANLPISTQRLAHVGHSLFLIGNADGTKFGEIRRELT